MTSEQVKKIFTDREDAFFNYLRTQGRDPEVYEPALQIKSNRERIFSLIDECKDDELMMQRISKAALDIDAILPNWKQFSTSEI